MFQNISKGKRIVIPILWRGVAFSVAYSQRYKLVCATDGKSHNLTLAILGPHVKRTEGLKQSCAECKLAAIPYTWPSLFLT